MIQSSSQIFGFNFSQKVSFNQGHLVVQVGISQTHLYGAKYQVWLDQFQPGEDRWRPHRLSTFCNDMQLQWREDKRQQDLPTVLPFFGTPNETHTQYDDAKDQSAFNNCIKTLCTSGFDFSPTLLLISNASFQTIRASSSC